MSEVEKMNPLLRKNKLPGETIRLPSRGLFYKNGELDPEVKDGEITLHCLTTVDEIMLKTPDMLFQGTAIDKVFRRCSPQILKPLDLLSTDVDYILTYLRKISYGRFIPITYDCQKCKNAIEEDSKEISNIDSSNEYMIPVDHFIETSKEISDKDMINFSIKAKTGELIKLKPPTFREALELEQINVNKFETDEEMLDYIMRPLSLIIESVDGHTDKDDIREWLKESDRTVTEQIKKKIKSLTNWGPVFKYTITCKKCKQKTELTTPVNPVAFFTLPSSPEIAEG